MSPPSPDASIKMGSPGYRSRRLTAFQNRADFWGPSGGYDDPYRDVFEKKFAKKYSDAVRRSSIVRRPPKASTPPPGYAHMIQRAPAGPALSSSFPNSWPGESALDTGKEAEGWGDTVYPADGSERSIGGRSWHGHYNYHGHHHHPHHHHGHGHGHHYSYGHHGNHYDYRPFVSYYNSST